MTTAALARRTWGRRCLILAPALAPALAAALPTALSLGLAAPVRAQADPMLKLIKRGATPAAIQGQPDPTERRCTLLVPAAEASLQPLWIPPDRVAAKNRLGCLSSADAIYGPDGCPLRLCGTASGVIPLPGDSGAALASPQLPAP